MLCQRCQRHLRDYEGVKCGVCESRFHLRCVADAAKDHRNAGDRVYHWKCALCQNSEAKVRVENIPNQDETLLNIINAISEKFELVNKIQLPKLSNDLQQLKFITDNIVKQNEHILSKIDRYEKGNKEKPKVNKESRNYRRRNLSVSIHSRNFTEHNDNVPILPMAEKAARYRRRRRSYVLNKMFNLLNRKMRRTTAQRKHI